MSAAPVASSAAADEAWIRRYRPAPEARVSLACFPHAGGSANFYLPAARGLAPAVEVLSMQYPGRQDRRAEPSVDTIAGLADLAFVALSPVARSADRPFALWGHSMGAIVAFEVALRLRAQRLPAPVRLIVSGRRAPSCLRGEQVHTGGDEAIIAELRALGGTAETLLADAELREMIMSAVRADYHAIETYRYAPGPSLDCPVSVLTGDSDPHVTLDEAQAWALHTTAATDVSVFPGGHFFLVEQAAQVLDHVAHRLAGDVPVDREVTDA
ncbi:thioesterase II family protein [Dactylosporangium sp. NPDC048998]|uniref:thioesterase II family protein n=1 Tax=Dactylosporangium sp. NPDC048998 TaxID=3363976 RepID=UPI003711B2DE